MQRFAIPIIVLTSLDAAAQPAAAQAEALFRQAKELLANGSVAEACAAFDASEKLEPTASTLLNLANCREQNGQLATAWGLFLEAERRTRDATDSPTKQLHDIATQHAAKLEPRLSTLTIAVAPDARIGGLEILRAGEVVDRGAWSKTLPIDGGTYDVTARAPGNAQWTATVTIANERDAKTIEVPRLKAVLETPSAPSTPASSPPSTTEPTEPTESAERPESSPPQRSWLPYYVAGGAVVTLGAAVALELVARSTYDDAKANLDVSRWHTANAERYTSEGLAVAGLAGAGIAVWLYLTDRSAASGVAIAPVVATDRVAIELVGGF